MELSPFEPSGPAVSPMASPPTGPTQASQQYRFVYHGTGSALFVLVLKNILLTLVTLGIYAPWAKAERRKFTWQNLEIDGHRLRWHGTGREMFLGYVKVVVGYAAFVGLPLAVRSFAGVTAGSIVQGVLTLVLLPLIPVAIYSSRRYLLSRTSYRGIRFAMDPGAGAYARKFIGGYLLTIITLGFYGPIWMNRLYGFITERSALGNKRFSYTGSDKEVFKISMKGMVLSILTLGIYLFWYQAELSRYQSRHTHFDGAHLELSFTGGELFKLFWFQILGLTFTLGFAFPWITTYTLRFTAERLRFVGNIDFSHLYQARSEGSAAADGMADALDVGLSI